MVTKDTIPALEKMISERDAQIDFLTKNAAAMEVELRRLKGQSTSLQQDLATAKQDRDAETVARVELESLLQVRRGCTELIVRKSCLGNSF